MVKKIAIVAGEASGDWLGSRLMHSLRKRYPDVKFEGIGGPAMEAAGCHSLFDMERLAVMGFIEPLLRLPDLIKLRLDLVRHILRHPPDFFIGVDAPDFNLGVELKLRKAGIPVVHYVSPGVWAWRQYRIHKIAKSVNLMLTLLPFEAAFYQKHGVPVRYVGHPLAEQLPLVTNTLAAKRDLCLDEHAHYIALLPGSRREEIRYMGEPMLRAAQAAWRQRPELRFITAHVNEQRYQEFSDCHKNVAPDLPLTFFTQRSQDVIAASDVVVVTSGTATLETMLCKKPMIIAYRMSSFTWQLAKRLIKVNWAGLPNLLANESVVPELIQDAVDPRVICDHILDYLDHPEKVVALQKKFTELHHALRHDANDDVLDAIDQMITSA